MILHPADNLKIGSSQVTSAYLGSNLVWNYIDVQLTKDWLNRISTIGGVAPSTTVYNASIYLLNSLRQTGVLSKILRMNLFCGGDWKASLVPLIATAGIGYDYNGRYAPNSGTQGPFGAGDWSLTTGFNASSNANYQSAGTIAGNTNSNTLKIIDTTVPQNYSALTNYSVHFSCYISGGSPGGNITINTDLGVNGSGGQNFTFQPAYSGNAGQVSRFNCYSQDANSTAGGTLASPMSNPLGFFVGSRVSSSYSTIYRSGLSSNLPMKSGSGVNPNTQTATAPNLDTSTFMVFGRGTAGTYGAANKQISNITDRTMYMYSIGTGLTDADVLNFNNAIAFFNTMIGRTNY